MVAFCTAVQKASIPFNYSLFTLNFFRGEFNFYSILFFQQENEKIRNYREVQKREHIVHDHS